MAVQSPISGRPWPSIAGFDWDAGNREKCGKHGVSVAAIEAMFRRPIALYGDAAHSRNEERFKAIGKTDAGRSVVIVFTLRQRAGELHSPDQRPLYAREGDREL